MQAFCYGAANIDVAKMAPKMIRRRTTTDLRRQTLEQCRHTLVLDEVLDHCYTRYLVLKVRILDTGLDGVQRCGDGYRRDSTSDRCDKVLPPGRLVVVLDAEQIFLRHRGRTKKLGRESWRINTAWLNITSPRDLLRNFQVHYEL